MAFYCKSPRKWLKRDKSLSGKARFSGVFFLTTFPFTLQVLYVEYTIHS